ncbi:zinc transporter-like protein [Wolffia australiana]
MGGGLLHLSAAASKRRSSSSSSISSLFLLILSLRSFYSLLPLLRSSPPTFSLFPFSFLVSFFSFVLTALCFLLLPSSSDPPRFRSTQSIRSLLTPLAAKSLLLGVGFLLRFQSLRTCGTAATILVEFSGAIAGQSVSRPLGDEGSRIRKIKGLAALVAAFVFLSQGWDKVGCFPLSQSGPADGECVRILPLLLPFSSGFLGFFESSSRHWTPLRDLGRRRLRVASLGLTTAMLFLPALASFVAVSESREFEMEGLSWSLANTVVFGVVLAGNLSGFASLPAAKDFRREFLFTFLCTAALELFYNPLMFLPGFLASSFLLWIAVYLLTSPLKTPLALEISPVAESFVSAVARPLRHIWSERKSRKIALFLLINSAYMVVEFAAGFFSNSLGLISDACHMLFDCAALAIGLYASYISRLPASAEFNYGRGRFEVLSGYVNAVLLVLVAALIVLESFERIFDPQEITTTSLLSVSFGGLLVNVIGLVFFHEEHHLAHGGGACPHSHSDPDHLHHHPHHDHNHADHSDHHHHHHHPHHDQNHLPKHGNHNDHHHRPRHDHNHLPNHGDHSVHHHHPHHDQNHLPSHGDHSHHHRSNHGHDYLPNHHHPHHDQKHHPNPEDCSHHHHPLHEHNHLPDHGDHCEHHHPHHDHSHGLHSNHPHAHHDHNQLPKPKDLSHHHHPHHDHHLHNHGHHSHQPCAHHDQHLPKPKDRHHHDSHDHKHCDHPHHQHHRHHQSQLSWSEEHRKNHLVDHNMRGIFLHVLADTMGSVGVVISTLLVKYKGWLAADPACSILISAMIIFSVVPLLRNSAEILLQRAPRALEWEIEAAIDSITRMNGISGIDRLHFWSLTTKDVVGTVHLRISADQDMAVAREQVSGALQEAGVNDLTIQLEHDK